jgi:hypothetical protein
MQELTAEQWGLWRRHPVTELVLDRYFDDFLADMERRMMAAWLDGKLTLHVELDARGYFHGLRHMQRVTLPVLRQFWNIDPMVEPMRRPSGTGYS